MPNSNNIQMGIQKALTQAAAYVAEEIKNTLKNGTYPGRDDARGLIPIEDSIRIGKASNTSISIYIGSEQAPYARAYEFGSGEHAGRGKYPIPPKNKKALAFTWEGHEDSPPWGSKKFIGVLSDGRFLFRYVEHPGVAAKPYIKPTILKTRERVREILGREFKAALLAGTERVEVIK